jgi:hypothetical protein
MDEDDRSWIVDGAIKHNLGTPEEIQLYNELSMALELDENDNYDVVNSGIGGGIDFGITTPYPDGLPENVGAMFFNVDTKFDVKVQETMICASVGERYFEISLKKV